MRKLVNWLLLIVMVMAMGMGLKSRELRVLAREQERCARDFWEFAKYCKTQDESMNLVDLPFPLDWPHLHLMHETIENNQISQFNKTRQIMATWYVAARANWKSFRAVHWGESYGAAIGSENDPKSMAVLDRVRYIYDRLPLWLHTPLAKANDHMLRFNDDVVIRCFPATKRAGASFTFTEVFLDELAYMEWGRQTWTSFSPALGLKGKAILLSTPDGMYNVHAELWHQHPNIAHVELAWWMVPGRDQEWYQHEAASGKYLTKAQLDTEQNLSFETFSGKPVYPTFDKQLHVKELMQRLALTKGQHLIIYRGWDFGFHHPACVWVWKTPHDQYAVIQELLGDEIEIDAFAEQVIDISKALFPNAIFRDFCDPAGKHPNTKSREKRMPSEKDQSNDIEIIEAVGREKSHPIHAEFCYENVATGIKAIQMRMRLRTSSQPTSIEQEPGILVDKGCRLMIQGFNGGYHWRETKDLVKEQPAEDGKYEHLFDAFRYIVINLDKKPKGGIKVAATQRQVVGEPTSAAKAQRNVPTGPRIVRMAA